MATTKSAQHGKATTQDDVTPDHTIAPSSEDEHGVATTLHTPMAETPADKEDPSPGAGNAPDADDGEVKTGIGKPKAKGASSLDTPDGGKAQAKDILTDAENAESAPSVFKTPAEPDSYPDNVQQPDLKDPDSPPVVV